jgi:hypothetical protein
LRKEFPEVFRDLQVLTVVGNKNTERFKEAEKRNNLFKRARPTEDGLPIEARTFLFLAKVETPLQGCKLLGEPSLNVPAKISHFLTLRLVKNPDAKDWVWKPRKLPHE